MHHRRPYTRAHRHEKATHAPHTTPATQTPRHTPRTAHRATQALHQARHALHWTALTLTTTTRAWHLYQQATTTPLWDTLTEWWPWP